MSSKSRGARSRLTCRRAASATCDQREAAHPAPHTCSRPSTGGAALRQSACWRLVRWQGGWGEGRTSRWRRRRAAAICSSLSSSYCTVFMFFIISDRGLPWRPGVCVRDQHRVAQAGSQVAAGAGQQRQQCLRGPCRPGQHAGTHWCSSCRLRSRCGGSHALPSGPRRRCMKGGGRAVGRCFLQRRQPQAAELWHYASLSVLPNLQSPRNGLDDAQYQHRARQRSRCQHVPGRQRARRQRCRRRSCAAVCCDV